MAYIHSPHGEKLSEWHSKTPGLPIQATFPGCTEFKWPAGSRFGIDQTSYPASVVERQPIVLSFLVEVIRQAVDELAAKGVAFYPSKEKTIFDAGPSLVATFADPDGNGVQPDPSVNRRPSPRRPWSFASAGGGNHPCTGTP